MFNPDELPPPMMMQQNYMPPPMPVMMPHHMQYQRPKIDGRGIASMVLGLVSLAIYIVGGMLFFVIEMLYWYGNEEVLLCPAIVIISLVTGAISLVLGIVSVRRISKSQGALGGAGFGITGIVLGSVGIGLSILFGILTIILIYEYTTQPYYYMFPL